MARPGGDFDPRSGDALAKTAQAAAASLRRQGVSGRQLYDDVLAVVGETHPGTSTRGRQAAAARATGFETPAQEERAFREAESADRRTTQRRKATGRRVVRSGSKAVRQAARAGRTATWRGLVVQALGLVALYYLLRTAGSVRRITDGTARVFDWLRDPRGIPGAPTG